MKIFTKQITNRFSILTIALICGLSMTACTAAERSTNDKASSAGGTEQSSSTADNKQKDNKTVENNSVEKEQAKSVKIYDGRDDSSDAKKPEKLSDAEKEFAMKELNANKEAIKKAGSEKYDYDGEPCETESLGVSNGVEGSFTKPNSKQKAIGYSLCQGRGPTGPSPFFIGGILIVEDGKIVANYVYGDISNYGDIQALPDINQNGLSEFILTSGNSHMGVTNSSISIMEAKDDGLTALGSTIVYSEDSPERMLTDKTNEDLYSAAFDISVHTGKTPVFNHEIYVQKTENGKWELKEKAKTFALENPGNGKTDEGFKKL